MTQITDPDGGLRLLVLPDSALAPRLARRAIRELLGTCPATSADQRDTATLLVSELVTNALRHADACQRGRRRFRLTARVSAGLLRVEVYDQDPTRPCAGDPGLAAEGGRGLSLLTALAKDWGTDLTPHQPGKTVWFTLPLG